MVDRKLDELAEHIRVLRARRDSYLDQGHELEAEFISDEIDRQLELWHRHRVAHPLLRA